MKLTVIWEESVSHTGPHGGCDMAVYVEGEDLPIVTQHFSRQISQINESVRTIIESRARCTARALIETTRWSK
jgi:hypothetical protein